MDGYSKLISALSSLLWPVFAFVALFVFREQLRVLLNQLAKLNRGKFLGMELEFSDTLKKDVSSDILRTYLWPSGQYDDQRRKVLNSLLRELGIMRDVRLILIGEEGAPFRNQLIEYAKKKGLPLTVPGQTGG